VLAAALNLPIRESAIQRGLRARAA